MALLPGHWLSWKATSIASAALLLRLSCMLWRARLLGCTERVTMVLSCAERVTVVFVAGAGGDAVSRCFHPATSHPRRQRGR